MKITMTKTLLLAVTFALLAPLTAVAEEPEHKAFTHERFNALQGQDAVILVDVWASWCSTCRAQSEVLSKLLAEDDFSEVHTLRLDWDEQKDHAESLNAWRQSTLIMFKGEREMARVVAETREEALRHLIESAI